MANLASSPSIRALLLTLLVVLVGCAPGAATPCPSALSAETCGVFQQVNLERADEGLPPYRWSPALAEAAHLHAQDMVDNNYFNHDSQDGRTFGQRAKEAGYEGFPAGENIAAGQRSVEAVMATWMMSTGHRSNILSEGSNDIGVGFFENHWVQVFGASK